MLVLSRNIGYKLENGDSELSFYIKDLLDVYQDASFSFTVTGTETIAVGGGSGGSYTPEKMVWENVKDERAVDTEYTNTNDVPLYVQLFTASQTGASWLRFYIDGERVGQSGSNSSPNTFSVVDTPLYIVPAGSTYKTESSGGAMFAEWREARMPVAVGTGGKTVAFRGELSANQTV